MTFKIACHMCGWPQEMLRETDSLLDGVRDAGYEGIEGVQFASRDQMLRFIEKARARSLTVVNLFAPTDEERAAIHAEAGLPAAEICFLWTGPAVELSEKDFREAAAKICCSCALFKNAGVIPYHHIHLGSILETWKDCQRILDAVSELSLLYDTGHLRAAGDDPMNVLKKFPKKIAHVHLKNFYAPNPRKWNHKDKDFWESGHRFCDLRRGNTGLDVKAVLDGLRDIGYSGWIAVEEDHIGSDPLPVARDNRKVIAEAGY